MKKEPMNAADKALKHEINFLHNQISIISNIDVVKSNHKNVGYTTMLCTDGTCSVLLNQRELHIKKNDLLFFGPNDKIEDIDKSEDLSMRGFYLTEEFFKELSNIPIGLINAHVYIAEHPYSTFATEQRRFLYNIMTLFVRSWTLILPWNTISWLPTY